MIPFQPSLPEPSEAEREPPDRDRPSRRKGLLGHIAEARAERLAAEAQQPPAPTPQPWTAGETAGLFVGAMVLVGFLWPTDPKPAPPLPEGMSYVILTKDVEGCLFPGGHCERFWKGERLIAGRSSINGSVRSIRVLRRRDDKLGYWIPEDLLGREARP